MTRYNELFEKINQDQLIDLDEMAHIDTDESGIAGRLQLFTSDKMLPHSIRVKYYPKGRRSRNEICYSFQWDNQEIKFDLKNSTKSSDLDSKELRLVIKWMTLNRRKIISYSLNAWRWSRQEQNDFLIKFKRVSDD